MALSESPIPSQSTLQMLEATKKQAASILAAAIITASGRPFSIAQALEIAQDVQFAMFPMHGNGVYMEWEKTKSQRLNKVYGPTSA